MEHQRKRLIQPRPGAQAPEPALGEDPQPPIKASPPAPTPPTRAPGARGFISDLREAFKPDHEPAPSAPAKSVTAAERREHYLLQPMTQLDADNSPLVGFLWVFMGACFIIGILCVLGGVDGKSPAAIAVGLSCLCSGVGILLVSCLLVRLERIARRLDVLARAAIYNPDDEPG